MQCLNCERELKQGDRYCSNCGQESADHSKSFAEMMRHFLGDYFTFDSKIFKSVVPILLKPGFLSAEFIAGRRVRYIPPIRLYIFISLLFFIAIGWAAPEQRPDTDDWDQYFGVYLPRLFFLLLPLFALLVWGLHKSKRLSYVIHLVFSLHFHSFLFLAGTIYLLFSELFERFEWYGLNLVLAFLFLFWMLTYLLLALRRVYAMSWAKVILRYLMLLLFYGVLLFVSGVFTLMLLD